MKNLNSDSEDCKSNTDSLSFSYSCKAVTYGSTQCYS